MKFSTTVLTLFLLLPGVGLAEDVSLVLVGSETAIETPATALADGSRATSLDALVTAIQGEWYSDTYRYGFEVVGGQGIATISNTPGAYQQGDQILRIISVENSALLGERMFTNGAWFRVQIAFEDTSIAHGGRRFYLEHEASVKRGFENTSLQKKRRNAD